jgi:ribosomal protein S18 acetylase RimI-like enzyme
MSEPLTRRPYQDETDYWRVRDFLREVFALNTRQSKSWDIGRWDYWRWHVYENLVDNVPLSQMAYLWENEAGRLAAMVNAEDVGDIYLQVHPAYQSAELDEEMVATAEEHLGTTDDEGRRVLTIFAEKDDSSRRDLLTRRGYTRQEGGDCENQRSLDLPIPDHSLPRGYTIRALGDMAELPARSQLSGKAFHPDDAKLIREARLDWQWYLNVQRAPLYRRDLDLVVVTTDGQLAAFATIWLDDVNRYGLFEPVGTDPDFQRRGLGRAILLEGMRRMQYYGATLAVVGSGTGPALDFYHAVGFKTVQQLVPWRKYL